MARRGRRTLQGELWGFAATLLFAALAYWFFTSGLYVTVMSGVAGWYAEQAMPRPGMPSEAPAPTRLGP
jgi:hypothetical protein